MKKKMCASIQKTYQSTEINGYEWSNQCWFSDWKEREKKAERQKKKQVKNKKNWKKKIDLWKDRVTVLHHVRIVCRWWLGV